MSTWFSIQIPGLGPKSFLYRHCPTAPIFVFSRLVTDNDEIKSTVKEPIQRMQQFYAAPEVTGRLHQGFTLHVFPEVLPAGAHRPRMTRTAGRSVLPSAFLASRKARHSLNQFGSAASPSDFGRSLGHSVAAPRQALCAKVPDIDLGP